MVAVRSAAVMPRASTMARESSAIAEQDSWTVLGLPVVPKS
ncbi:hypothetical protein AB0H12_20620 [Actinosynnema sp. NPDC023794]